MVDNKQRTPDNTGDVGSNTFVASEGSSRLLQLPVASGAWDKRPAILLEDPNNPSNTEEISFMGLYRLIN